MPSYNKRSRTAVMCFRPGILFTIYYCQLYWQQKQVRNSRRDGHAGRDFMILWLSRKITVIFSCTLTLVPWAQRPKSSVFIDSKAKWHKHLSLSTKKAGRRTPLPEWIRCAVLEYTVVGLWQIWQEQKGSHRYGTGQVVCKDKHFFPN